MASLCLGWQYEFVADFQTGTDPIDVFLNLLIETI